ncbi:MAG: LacI family DNA-binding transcriptional regulator [Planctomycetota bacterium]|nr:LacI family DNA-binding transcriptional regulator [Planctomycetota bacterium]
MARPNTRRDTDDGEAADHPPPRGPVSIHDVATAARVSIATVSRVMNNPHLVSPKTAARVQAVIRQIGYAPNPFAQGLVTRASRVLGIALPDLHGEFYSELLRGADGEARKLGYCLLVSSEHSIGGRPNGQGGLAFGLIDGLAVMITESDGDVLRAARDMMLPTVILDTDLANRGIDSVVIDNVPGTREAAEHLLRSTPAARLYFVGGPQENFDTQQRARAFVEALERAGHTPRADQVAFGAYTEEWGRRWVEGLGRAGPEGLTGVLAGNDEIAIGIMRAASDAGIGVPERMRLIGFDDTRLTTLLRPRLSAVRVPMAEVGAAAIRLLVRRVESAGAETTCVRLPTSLVVRESSSPAPGA